MASLSEILAKKFNPATWVPEAFDSYDHSGINLINEVNELDPDMVIDAGCGHNRFKGHIKNLIGFDLQPFPFADMHVAIEDAKFREGCADVVMALGSVQFGDIGLVTKQLNNIVSWTKPGGYIVMRVMYEYFGESDLFKSGHFNWTPEIVDSFTTQFNLQVTKGPFREKVYIRDRYHSTRLVWWWQKPNELLRYSINPFTCEVSER